MYKTDINAPSMTRMQKTQPTNYLTQKTAPTVLFLFGLNVSAGMPISPPSAVCPQRAFSNKEARLNL